MKRYKLYILLLAGFACSCTNVSEDDLIDSIAQGEDPITYSTHVKVIIDNNCLNCHSMPPQNGAPISLVNFQQVKNAVENSNLIGRISTQDLSQVMPLGGPRLPQNLIDIVVQWETDGLIEE